MRHNPRITRCSKKKGPQLMNELIQIEIEKDKLLYNLLTFRKLAGKKTILAPCLKGNAYGHGLIPVAKLFAESYADWLCVNSIQEAALLRKAGITIPILVAGYVQSGDLEKVFIHDVRIFLYNIDIARSLSRLSKKHKKQAIVHIKVDTGMSRQGIQMNEIETFISRLGSLPGLRLEGIATHFATAFNGKSDPFFCTQLNNFEKLKQHLQIAFPALRLLFHASNSAAVLVDKKSVYDLIRPGISLFGFHSSSLIEKICEDRKIGLKPTIKLKTKVAQIKTVPKGSCVSYGCTYITKKQTRLAIIPIGYADGMEKQFSNNGDVLISGKRAPIRGRICMTMLVADITHLQNVKREDEVVVIGKQKDEEITLQELSDKSGSSKGELLTGLKESIKRVYV